MSKDLIPGVLSWKGDMGLMGALENLCENPVEIPVSDQGTVLDMDFKEDCQALSDRILNLDIPTDLEIKALEAMAKTPERVLKHEAKVKDTALKIASLALEAGISIDKELLRSGALLHDLCRTEKDHPKAASVLLKSQGFDKLGDLVATHMDYPYKGLLDEGAVLYLADKLTFCDKFCTIDQRLSKMQEKFKDDENSLKWAEIRLEKARKISEDLSKIMGKDLMEALK